MARATGDSGAAVIIRSFNGATYIQIDIADDCHLKQKSFESLLWNPFKEMSANSKTNAHSGD